MLRHTRLCLATRRRVFLAETDKTGIHPRINKSPQGIVYDQKKKDYVYVDSKVQDIQQWGEWGNLHRNTFGLGDLMDKGTPMFSGRLSREDDVLAVRNKVIMRRRIKAAMAAGN